MIGFVQTSSNRLFFFFSLFFAIKISRTIRIQSLLILVQESAGLMFNVYIIHRGLIKWLPSGRKSHANIPHMYIMLWFLAAGHINTSTIPGSITQTRRASVFTFKQVLIKIKACNTASKDRYFQLLGNIKSSQTGVTVLFLK